tara:strand:+ start:1125 stop:1343 length:219 start_codon:yes stop_codon:yes gene_type:complete
MLDQNPRLAALLPIPVLLRATLLHGAALGGLRAGGPAARFCKLGLALFEVLRGLGRMVLWLGFGARGVLEEV